MCDDARLVFIGETEWTLQFLIWNDLLQYLYESQLPTHPQHIAISHWPNEDWGKRKKKLTVVNENLYFVGDRSRGRTVRGIKAGQFGISIDRNEWLLIDQNKITHVYWVHLGGPDWMPEWESNGMKKVWAPYDRHHPTSTGDSTRIFLHHTHTHTLTRMAGVRRRRRKTFI